MAATVHQIIFFDAKRSTTNTIEKRHVVFAVWMALNASSIKAESSLQKILLRKNVCLQLPLGGLAYSSLCKPLSLPIRLLVNPRKNKKSLLLSSEWVTFHPIQILNRWQVTKRGQQVLVSCLFPSMSRPGRHLRNCWIPHRLRAHRQIPQRTQNAWSITRKPTCASGDRFPSCHTIQREPLAYSHDKVHYSWASLGKTEAMRLDKQTVVAFKCHFQRFTWRNHWRWHRSPRR